MDMSTCKHTGKRKCFKGVIIMQTDTCQTQKQKSECQQVVNQ